MDGMGILCRVPNMSPEFLTLLDWFVHKSLFPTRPVYETVVGAGKIQEFITECYAAHSAPGAREELAAGQSNLFFLNSELISFFLEW